MKMTKGLWALLITVLVLVADQTLKIWVKTHFYIGEDYHIANWFQLLFVENNGMAFGMEIGSKLFLTVFRIILAIGLVWYIVKIKSLPAVPTGYIVCLALITAGAAGNIFDCMFYGLIFNDPLPPELAVAFPADGGYATLFHGKVVDMLYFPLFSFDWPNWMPFVGGTNFLFFQPVFNIADAAISVGMILLILFYSKSLYYDPRLLNDNRPADA